MRSHGSSIVRFLLLTCFISPVVADDPPATKALLEVPDGKESIPAFVKMRSKFGISLKKGETQENARELVGSLLEHAAKQTDRIDKYVALEEAGRLAAVAADVELAKKVGEEMVKVFDTDRYYFSSFMVLSGQTFRQTRPQQLAFVDWAFELGKEALAEDRIETAYQFFRIGAGLARGAKAQERLETLRKWRGEVYGLRDEFKEYVDFRDQLEENPLDPEASHGWGSYLCFARGRWEQGLMLLTSSNDADVAGAAKADRKRPTREAERLAVAEKWLVVHRSAKSPLLKEGAVVAAKYWLDQAAKETDSAEAIAKRIKDLPQVFHVKPRISPLQD